MSNYFLAMKVFTLGTRITVCVRFNDTVPHDMEFIKLNAIVCVHTASSLKLMIHRAQTTMSWPSAMYLILSERVPHLEFGHSSPGMGNYTELFPENGNAIQRILPFQNQLKQQVMYIDYETAFKATLAFLLVAPYLPLHKDIVPRIARLVYEPEVKEIRF
jgi:hypothetical protein